MSTNLVPMPAKVWSDTPTLPRRELLWIQGGKKCFWCGNPTRLSKDQAWDSATVDHVIPRYKGGTNDPDNLVSACQRCNNRRSHEDARGLPEGHLLGKWKIDAPNPPNPIYNPSNRVALTRDEKKQLLAKLSKSKISADQIHIEQRDKALHEVKNLRERIESLESDASLYKTQIRNKDATIADLTLRLDSMTVASLIRRRLLAWLLRGD